MSFTIVKTANYKHKVVFNNAYDTMDIICVKYEYWNNGSPDSDNYIVNVANRTSDYTINLSDSAYRDGVYVVEVTGVSGGSSSVFQYMLYDLTDTFVCYNSLMQTIFISSIDQQCKPCDEDEQETIERARMEANKMLILIGQLLAYVDPVSAQMFGLFNSSNNSKSSYERYAGDIMDKIKEIVARCNDCD